MKPRIKSMIRNIRKQKTTNWNRRKKEKENNNEGSINSLLDNCERSNIHIIGVPEGKEKTQENENLFEKIMKENFPNLVNRYTNPAS